MASKDIGGGSSPVNALEGALTGTPQATSSNPLDPGASPTRSSAPVPAAPAPRSGARTPTGGMIRSLLDNGMKLIGVPYVYGGTDPKTGLDCSALVKHLYAQQGIQLPRVAADQAQQGTAVDASSAQPGDLVAFNNNGAGIDHIGIYLGNGLMLQAPHTGASVQVVPVDLTSAAAIRRVAPPSAFAGLPKTPGGGYVYQPPKNIDLTGGTPPNSSMSSTPSPQDITAGAPAGVPLTAQLQPNSTLSINQYGFIAALANKVPELKKLMAEFAGQDLGNSAVQARLEARIRDTGWFKKTTDAQRQAQVLQATNPSEYMRQFQQTNQKVSIAAQNLGVQLPGLHLHDFAAQALNNGWTDAEIKQYLLAEGQKVTSQQTATGQATPGRLQTSEADLRSAASDYMVPLSAEAYGKWSQDIAAGRATPADFQTYLKEQAKSLFPAMGNAIDRGITPNQYLDPYRTYASNILERPAQSIDFLHDPTFGKAVFQTDPKTGERTAMNLADWQTYLRGLPDYQKTNQAKDQAAQFAEQIASQFGKVAY